MSYAIAQGFPLPFFSPFPFFEMKGYYITRILSIGYIAAYKLQKYQTFKKEVPSHIMIPYQSIWYLVPCTPDLSDDCYLYFILFLLLDFNFFESNLGQLSKGCALIYYHTFGKHRFGDTQLFRANGYAGHGNNVISLKSRPSRNSFSALHWRLT